MIKRLLWRVQPVSHIAKREQRHREMMQREKAFKKFLEVEKKKLNERKKG
jgi:hypothetical protein